MDVEQTAELAGTEPVTPAPEAPAPEAPTPEAVNIIMAQQLFPLCIPPQTLESYPEGFMRNLIIEMPQGAQIVNVSQFTSEYGMLYYIGDQSKPVMPVLVTARVTGQPSPQGWGYVGCWTFSTQQRTRQLISVPGSPGKHAEVETIYTPQHIFAAPCPDSLWQQERERRQQAGDA